MDHQPLYGIWQQFSLAVLAGLVLGALIFDVRQRRIPNILVVLTLCLGALFNSLGPVLRDGGGLFTSAPGALGVSGAVLGALTGLAVFLPLYLLRVMGAGDVKLLAGIGSFVGTLGVLNLVPFILAAGGLLAVVTMVWLKSTRQVLFNVSLAFNQMVSGQGGGFDPRQSVYRMPYTVAIAGGMLANGLWLLAGARPLIHF